jgi:hypothetical protein
VSIGAQDLLLELDLQAGSERRRRAGGKLLPERARKGDELSDLGVGVRGDGLQVFARLESLEEGLKLVLRHLVWFHAVHRKPVPFVLPAHS